MKKTGTTAMDKTPVNEGVNCKMSSEPVNFTSIYL